MCYKMSDDSLKQERGHCLFEIGIQTSVINKWWKEYNEDSIHLLSAYILQYIAWKIEFDLLNLSSEDI